MDSLTIAIIVVVAVSLIGWYFLAKLRPKAPGTYGDPQLRSQGNIAHTGREYRDSAILSDSSVGKDEVAASRQQESGGTIAASAARARSDQRMTDQGAPVEEFMDAETLPHSRDKGNGPHATAVADEGRRSPPPT